MLQYSFIQDIKEYNKTEICSAFDLDLDNGNHSVFISRNQVESITELLTTVRNSFSFVRGTSCEDITAHIIFAVNISDDYQR